VFVAMLLFYVSIVGFMFMFMYTLRLEVLAFPL